MSSNLDIRDSSSTLRSKAKSFDQCYKSYCKNKNISPLRNLMKNTEFVLDFCVDKIKFSQWEPILIAIGDDISLECLSIRCRCPNKNILENIDSEMKAKSLTKSPAVLTRYVLWKLIDSVSQCLSQTPLLNILQIEGLPLPEPYIDLLVEGLSSNNTLKYLGLNGCQIGDYGCQKICSVLRNINNILILNLSGCNLTSKGISHVADMINFVKIMRYSENWQHTLRYQSPDLDSMAGLRRITLSDNPDMGDNGLVALLNVLLDDLWVKALDVQHCGITDNILKDCLNFFENNSCLQALDLRFNQQMTVKSFGTIMAALRKNESSSIKYAPWYLISNNPVFRNNQKINSMQKSSNPKERNLKSHFSSMSLTKYESGECSTDSIQVHLLKEQLKNEMALRRKSEELNAKLLQQVKELKSNQIAIWKAQTHGRNENINKINEVGDNVDKKKDSIMINLNQEMDGPDVQSIATSKIIENGNNVEVTTQMIETSEGTQMINKNIYTEQITNINLRGCSGVNLLESLLQQKRSKAHVIHMDGYTSEASSDSSEGTLCYMSGSSRSTVVHMGQYQ